MLKLACVNIEMNNHYPDVEAFLNREQPDVLCMQEVLLTGVGRLAENTAMPYAHFAPMNHFSATHFNMPMPALQGQVILSRRPLTNLRVIPYAGNGSGYDRVAFPADPLTTIYAHTRYMLVVADVEMDGKTYTFATTHFTWTPDDGIPDGFQKAALAGLLRESSKLGPLVLCGDFNAPRGLEIFDTLAKKFTDNIPPEYTNSIDKPRHRSFHRPNYVLKDLMVDGLFTTPEYKATQVKLHTGVSDHMAITANIEAV